MRSVTLVLVTLATAAGVNLLVAQKAPDKIVFNARNGNVTFDHAEHAKLAKNNCTTCHYKLFPQSREAINFKAGMHKTAEAAKTFCGGCHNPGGPSFETTGNCAKCHVKS